MAAMFQPPHVGPLAERHAGATWWILTAEGVEVVTECQAFAEHLVDVGRARLAVRWGDS